MSEDRSEVSGGIGVSAGVDTPGDMVGGEISADADLDRETTDIVPILMVLGFLYVLYKGTEGVGEVGRAIGSVFDELFNSVGL